MDVQFSSLASLISEILHLKKAERNTHISRSQNNCSDYMAKFRSIEGQTVVWLHSGLRDLEQFE